MDSMTPIAALVLSCILLPAVAALWMTKADSKTVEGKADSEDVEHVRQWLTQHSIEDREMFKELREGHKDIQKQLRENFETLIMEIRRNGNGNH